MSDDIWGVLITTWGTVLVAIIGAVGAAIRTDRRSRQRDARFDQRLTQVAADTHESREQLQNTHTTNLRDDLDRLHHSVIMNHQEVTRRLDRLDEQVSRESFDADEERTKLRRLINQVAASITPGKET